MPYSKRFIGIAIVINIALSVLFGCFNFYNPFYSKKKIKTVNLQENIQENNNNNNYREKIVEAIIDNLDSVIMNTTIFLLVFAISICFVYFSSLSPVARNNLQETIGAQTKNKSIFRKTVLYEFEKYFKKEDFYYFYDKEDKNEGLELLSAEKNPHDNKYKIGGNFHFEQYHGNITIYSHKKKTNLTLKEIENIKKNSINGKEKIFYDFTENIPERRLRKYDLNTCSNKKIKQFCFSHKPSFQEFYACFKERKKFFNLKNFFAALFSYFFFLLFFAIFYLTLYFFYVLFSSFFSLNDDEEEIKKKENKFLFAFLKTLDAIIFLNFDGLLKIIPFLSLLIALLLDIFLFFRKSRFVPVVYEIGKINTEKAKFYFISRDGGLEFPINENYESPFFLPPKKDKQENKISAFFKKYFKIKLKK